MSTYARFFVRRTRRQGNDSFVASSDDAAHPPIDDGTTFYTLSDDHPEWLYDAVQEAHDGEFPNDWRYEHCLHIVSDIDNGSYDPGEIADSLVDIYDSDRLRWLADDPSRTAYCDEAQSDGLAGDDPSVIELAGIGQYLAIERMASILLEAIQENGGES